MACDGCTTLGDAFVAGQVIADAPLSSLTDSSEFGEIELGDLLDAFTLEYLFGVGEVDPLVQTAETLGEIADPGNLTLGQLLVSLILRSDFPWENISLSDLDPQAFAADNVVGYRLDFELNGTLVEPSLDCTCDRSNSAAGGLACLNAEPRDHDKSRGARARRDKRDGSRGNQTPTRGEGTRTSRRKRRGRARIRRGSRTRQRPRRTCRSKRSTANTGSESRRERAEPGGGRAAQPARMK